MTSDVRAALDAGDDGFHEIQLNGKQLVFLGMATTLVSVVIFLCGVLVGRGVKPLDTVAQAGGPQAFETPVTSPVAPGAIATPAPAPPAAPAPSAGGGTSAAAAAAPDAGSAGDTEPTPLGDDPDTPAPPPASDLAAAAPAKPPAVEPKTPKAEPRPAAKPAPAPVQASAAPPAPVAAPKPTPAAAPAPTPVAAMASAGGGPIAVQVGAFATRKEADALAKKLSGRGYAVYVMNPIDDGRNVYRVRVGNYSTADEAQRVSARLTQQEKLKPWVIR
jgi:cell division septation protein DedD